MKIRNGFISNSSSSSFVIGFSGEKKEIKYGETYNLDKLIQIKKNCIESKLSIPKEILDIEKKAGVHIESISKDDIIEIIEEIISIPERAILKLYDDEIAIDVTKLPKKIKIIKFQFSEG